VITPEIPATPLRLLAVNRNATLQTFRQSESGHGQGASVLSIMSRNDIELSSRPWQLIAVELSSATDPEKIQNLTRELHLALCEQDVNRSPFRDCGDEKAEARLL
jgi:hypothetical protein